MEQGMKNELFDSMPIPKAVIRLAIPTVLSSLVMILYSMADTYFVSMLNDPIQNAAVTLASPLLLAFNAVNNLFGVGASSLISRSLGVNDRKEARHSSTFGIYGAVFAGLLISVFSFSQQGIVLGLLGTSAETMESTNSYLFWTVYLGAVPSILNVVLAHIVRAEGASLHASLGTMTGCVLNIVLDPVFILPEGMDLGAAGAGMATFLSNCAACLYFFLLIFYKRKQTCICMDPRELRLSRRIVLGVCGIGVPSALQNLLNVIGAALLNNFAAAYGADVVAAMGIANKIYTVPLQISLGFAQGVMPMIGYNYASGNDQRWKKTFWFTLDFSIIAMTLVSAAFFFWSDEIVRRFIANQEIIAYGGYFLQIMSLALPFLCLDFIAVIIFQACGLGKQALFFAILRKALLEIPALILLNKMLLFYGLPWAQVVAEVGMAIAAVVLLRRIFKNSKNHSLSV